MSHVRLGERSDCDASLILNEVEREQRLDERVLDCYAIFRRLNRSLGALNPESATCAIPCLPGRATILSVLCPVTG